MKKKITDTELYIILVVIILVITLAFLGSLYLVKNPELRNISYYNDDNYYMCDVVIGDGYSASSHHYGAIKKVDYDKWKNGEIGTVWITSSNDKNKGWRFRYERISSIQLYDEGWLPFNF